MSTVLQKSVTDCRLVDLVVAPGTGDEELEGRPAYAQIVCAVLGT